jgi:hypothetical protein
MLPQRLFRLGQASLYAASDRIFCFAGEPRRKEAGTNAIVTELPFKVLPPSKAFGPIVPDAQD